MSSRFFLLALWLLLAQALTAQTIQLAKNIFGKSEWIKVQYSNVPLTSAVYIINITAQKNPDNGLESYKYVRDTESGEVELRSMGYEGAYEVRLLRYKSTNDTNPEVVGRKTFTIGTPPPKASSLKCNTALPKVVGKPVAGAPTLKQVTTILRGVLAERNAPLGKEGKDVCVEFGPLQFLPKSKVKLFSDWTNPGQAALPAWPVKVLVTLKIPKGDELEIKQVGTGDEVFYFYRDDKGAWNFKAGKRR
jgi:hypothetical protein